MICANPTEEELRHKVNLVNNVHREIIAIKEARPELRCGYYPNSYGSLLNAYREGDITYTECIHLLKKIEKGNARDGIIKFYKGTIVSLLIVIFGLLVLFIGSMLS